MGALEFSGSADNELAVSWNDAFPFQSMEICEAIAILLWYCDLKHIYNDFARCKFASDDFTTLPDWFFSGIELRYHSVSAWDASLLFMG